MNADRELLELAAKAAGIKGKFCHPCKYYPEWGIFPDRGVDHTDFWNPLYDDGAALRLAVTLGMGISIPLANKRTDVCCFSHATLNVIVAHEDDPYAATRRAIVTMAAEIGKEMP